MSSLIPRNDSYYSTFDLTCWGIYADLTAPYRYDNGTSGGNLLARIRETPFGGSSLLSCECTVCGQMMRPMLSSQINTKGRHVL